MKELEGWSKLSHQEWEEGSSAASLLSLQISINSNDSDSSCFKIWKFINSDTRVLFLVKRV